MKTIFIITMTFKNGDKTRFAVSKIEHAMKCAEENKKFTHVKSCKIEQSVLYEQ